MKNSLVQIRTTAEMSKRDKAYLDVHEHAWRIEKTETKTYTKTEEGK